MRAASDGLSALRVLYVTAAWDATYRYRCRHGALQLRAAGAGADVAHVDDDDLLALVPSYSLVVLFRLPWSARVAAICAAARASGARLAFETDDLIFDPSVEPLVHFLPDLGPSGRAEYRQRFTRLRATFDACDLFVGSTPALTALAERLGKPAVLHPNLLPPSSLRTAPALRALARVHPPPPTLAYLSGSNTHDRDFLSIVAPLADVLASHPDARLLVCGYLDLPRGLGRFAHRIVRVPYLDWRVYPAALAGCRAALAPAAVVNAFTDAKSVAKFFDAGILGVPVVATPTEPFRLAITNGVDGRLPGTADEWRHALADVLDAGRSRTLGNAARRTVLGAHTFAAHRRRLAALLAPFAGTAAGPAPAARSLDPTARGMASDESPSTEERLRQTWMLVRGEVPRNRDFVPPALPAWQEPTPPARAEAMLDTLATRGAGAVSDERSIAVDVFPASMRHVAAETEPSASPDVHHDDGTTTARARTHRASSLFRADLDVAPADVRWLVVRLALTTDAPLPAASFAWASEEAPGFVPERTVAWPLVADGRAHTYVVDLAATTWRERGRVTRLRLDVLEGAGHASVERVVLLADLAQLLPDANLRGVLAARHLRGTGIECGALQNPLAAPAATRTFYVDRLTLADARAHYPELEGQPLTAPNVVGDVQRLPIGDACVDFCVGNHLLEHARDPIAALAELLRVVRPGGVLYVSVPDVGNPLDRGRAVTPFGHLLADHEPGRDRSAEDAAHYREYTDSAHPTLDERMRREVEARFLAQGYSVHFHTFDAETFRQLCAAVAARTGARLIELVRNPCDGFDEHVALLRRTRIGPRSGVRPPVDVVVPVYGARRETIACLESVLRHATGDWRLVVVDDASPDAELVPWLDALAARDPRVTLLRNAENLGFVRTANHGMRHAGERDVLLLNSDTVVAAGFLERLADAVYADATTGIVSPLSNNATILSVPVFCRPNVLPDGHTVDSFADLIARTSLRLRPELPTAHGFCMYVRAEVLERVGLFDAERFPRGYGEENDLCERALDAGFRIRVADDVFVYHAGEASFGEETHRLRTSNDVVLEGLHPGYFAKVARFVEANPLAPIQQTVECALRRDAASREPALLVLLHESFDRPFGGTEHHVHDLVGALALPRVIVAVPRADGIDLTEVLAGDVREPLRWRVALERPIERFEHTRPDVDAALAEIVRLFGVGAVHVQHPLNWPADLGRTLAGLGVPWVVTAHDYYSVCPNPNLVDPSSGRPCCLDPSVAPGACLRALFGTFGLPAPNDAGETLARHRTDLGELLTGAEVVLFPSETARDVVLRFQALDRARTQVVPHGYAAARPAPRAPSATPVRVALLGQIAYAIKGADAYPLLLDQTRHLPIEWHVFGDAHAFGYAARLRADRLVLHGPYARDRIAGLLADARIDVVVLLPNWPETFSYTLSEALLAGVPVIAASQGALAERLAGSDAGILVDDVDGAAAALERLVREPDALARLQAGAAHLEHRTLANMAADYRPLYTRLLAAAPRPVGLDLAARRALFTAALRAREHATAAGPPPPVLGHYGQWWYPVYERVAAMVPPAARRWARERVAEREWPTLRVLDVAQPTASDDLDLLARDRYRARGPDPWLAFAVAPLPPREARLIRFELRHDAPGTPQAQVYWTHEPGEHFSEEKSLRIPLDPANGTWREYTIRIDDTDRVAQWDAGDVIRSVRFDPLNVPGVVEVRAIRLCGIGR